MHAINAWDEDGGNTVVMVAPNVLSVEHTFERMNLIHDSVEKVKIDLKTGIVTRQPLSTRNLDFAVINPAYVGKKNSYTRLQITDSMKKFLVIKILSLTIVTIYIPMSFEYVYAAMGDSTVFKLSGVVKLDVSLSEDDRRDCIVASRMFGPGCYGGEPFFVAKSPRNPQADEDDGYVLDYVHDENTGESKFLVMAAKSPDLVRESELNKL
ncbi:unnamed protein product [Ilex paraguariensis]|uniref:Uncharacterized protein n=1 Tax=Ilex paraguariensis TaxID=185542 RepID=A0ABC8QW34_9AQUA